MGSCTRRHFLLSTCFLQMISIIERQVFDFLGYMWAPIFVNFFHMLFVIFGFYGAYHFRIKYIVTYLLWNFLWIGWNSFIICFYLNLGVLNKDSDLLNLGTGSVSWFEVNGYGCKPTYPSNITSDDPFRPIRPELVDDCLIDYTLVEVIQSGVQCALALFGILGALFISYIFLDEDDRFDFMNGDAKSPQHTVVHPMYVSYTSIPTSASATMQSNQHQHHPQQQNSLSHHTQQNYQQTKNNAKPLTHKNSNNKHFNESISYDKSNCIDAKASNDNTITNTLFNINNNRIASSSMSITTRAAELTHQQLNQNFQYYDDSTAKADQLYTNSNRRHQQMMSTTYHPKLVTTPISSNDNTTSSLSYESLQNSNLYLVQSLRESCSKSSVGEGIASSLNKSNYSFSNSINNNINVTPIGIINSSRLSRKHYKAKPAKSTSYSSFIKTDCGDSAGTDGNIPRSDKKYLQMSIEQYSHNPEENFEDENFSLEIFKTDNNVTYVPFQSPTPNSIFINSNNNNSSYTSLSSHQQPIIKNNTSPNNNSDQESSSIFLKSDTVLQGTEIKQYSTSNQAKSFVRQQKGLSKNYAYTPAKNIWFPNESFKNFETPLELAQPSLPAPCPHILEARSGNSAYPDLSPEVTEKYAMPSQYVSRSPVATRITRRHRQPERSHLANMSANFCDQIRDAPPGYMDTGFSIVRAQSHGRLQSSLPKNAQQNFRNDLSHINRGIEQCENKVRPRSYCNSIDGHDGTIHVNTAGDYGSRI